METELIQPLGKLTKTMARVYNLLQGGWFSTRDICIHAYVASPRKIISELRAAGYLVKDRKVTATIDGEQITYKEYSMVNL